MKQLPDPYTALEVSRYGAFSGPYFPALGLNTDQKTKYLGTFHAFLYFTGYEKKAIFEVNTASYWKRFNRKSHFYAIAFTTA